MSLPSPAPFTCRVSAESCWLPLVFSQLCAWYLVGALRNKWIHKSREAELDSVGHIFYSKEEEFIALFPWMDNPKKETGKPVLGSSCSFPVWCADSGAMMLLRAPAPLSSLTCQTRPPWKDPGERGSSPWCPWGINVSFLKAFTHGPGRNQVELKFAQWMEGRMSYFWDTLSGLGMFDITEHLGQGHSKHLMCNPHREGPMKLVLLFLYFTDEETKAQRGYVTCPRSHSQRGMLARTPKPCH